MLLSESQKDSDTGSEVMQGPPGVRPGLGYLLLGSLAVSENLKVDLWGWDQSVGISSKEIICQCTWQELISLY